METDDDEMTLADVIKAYAGGEAMFASKKASRMKFALERKNGVIDSTAEGVAPVLLFFFLHRMILEGINLEQVVEAFDMAMEWEERDAPNTQNTPH